MVRSALWFSAYTFARPGEIRKAEWTKIDLEAAEWRIPAEKMKIRRPHIVPLARQAVRLLVDLRGLTGCGVYVFPSLRSTKGTVPMSENTVLYALRRMGFDATEMTAHGFRGMAGTRLNEMGWAPDVIERQLAHLDANKVRAAYNHAEYPAERREMMQAWADYLEGLGQSMEKPLKREGLFDYSYCYLDESRNGHQRLSQSRRRYERTCLQFRCSPYTSLSQDEPNSLLSIPSSLQIAGINAIVNNPASPALQPPPPLP